MLTTQIIIIMMMGVVVSKDLEAENSRVRYRVV